MAWIEQGTCNQRPGDTLVGIEQEGFGMVCAVLDYEGESVHRILRAVNAYDELLAACKLAIHYADQAILGGGPVRDDGDVMRAIRAAVEKAKSLDGNSAE